jgi:Tfp pilus assembly protein PilN
VSSEVGNITTNNKVIFRIDLLKGQGIPPKSGPVGLVIGVVTAIVPVILVIMIVGFYRHNKVTMSIRQQEIAKLETKAGELSGAVKYRKALEQKKVHYSACISEVNSSIGKFTQWSPVLAMLVDNMPGKVVLTDLKVELDSVEKEVPKKDNPKKKVTINVPVNKLWLSVSDSGRGGCDEAVKEFRDRLWSSPVLGPRLANIDVSHRTDEQKGKDIVFYEINCLFKPEL